MAFYYEMPPQVEGHVNQNPLCIMFINEDGNDIYYANMNGDLTVSEQKFFQYIGRPELNPDHRNEWRRSVDVTNFFIQLIKDGRGQWPCMDLSSSYETMALAQKFAQSVVPFEGERQP